ncbi:MAG: deoxynucleoside kinase [Bacteroidia bacterium]
MYICIEGNIGAGKTTMAHLLAEELGAKLILEEFEENYLLPLFYKEPATFAFPLEYSFLLDRYRQLKKHESELASSFIISDYFIEKCLYFARVNLKPTEFAIFESTYSNLIKTLPQPGLLIYFHLETGQLKDNIRKRDREFENRIEADYLDNVSAQYESFSKKERNFQVINFHLRTNTPENYELVFREIISFLKQGSSVKWLNIEI